ncbi:MAG: hypothetical protein SA339_02790 [Methanomassiliicoccus sp.]|nr:hypothetical protein [Methanomassiliicoccus sp.]
MAERFAAVRPPSDLGLAALPHPSRRAAGGPDPRRVDHRAGYDPLPGVAVSLALWVPINALSEQLLWVYIFEAFQTRWKKGVGRVAGTVVGVLMTIIFVGLIHALFWGEFLPGFRSVFPLSQIFLSAQFVMTVGYLLLFQRTRSMVPLFLLHIIADAALVLGAAYSIVPDLWTL